MIVNTDNLVKQINELAEDVELDTTRVRVVLADYENVNGERIQFFLTATGDSEDLWDKTYPQRICITPEEEKEGVIRNETN